MSYIPISNEGGVVSFGPNAFNTAFLAACKPSSGTLTISEDVPVVTAMLDVSTVKIPALKSASFSSDAFALSAPIIGNTGEIAFSSGGYALHVFGWNLSIAPVAIHDITEPNATSPPEWKSFQPDLNSWKGTFTAGIDSTTALVNPPAAGTASGSLPTLTLKIDSTRTFAGTVILQQLGATVRVGNLTMATYAFEGTGTLTPAGSGNPLGTTASALNRFISSLGGTATGSLVFAAKTGARTYTSADGFLSGVNFSCQRGSPVLANFSIQCSGAVTIA